MRILSAALALLFFALALPAFSEYPRKAAPEPAPPQSDEKK